MDSWEKIDEILPPKEDFYSELTLEDISDKGYAHAQKVWEWFEIRNRGEYHDLYVQSDTLLLADVFEKFDKWQMHWNIWTWSFSFLICTWTSMTSMLKKQM